MILGHLLTKRSVPLLSLTVYIYTSVKLISAVAGNAIDGERLPLLEVIEV